MRKSLLTGLMVLAASPALARGIERNPQSMAILFQEGTYLELGTTIGRPRVSGTLSPDFGGAATGSIIRNFVNGALSFRSDINETLSFAIILDQPFVADTLYPGGSALAGSRGSIENTSLTGVLRYSFDENFSAFAGVRSSWTNGSAQVNIAPPALPLPALAYSLDTNTDQAFGFLLGVAYEIPDIALRVSLTYNSKIRHSFRAQESATVLTEMGPVVLEDTTTFRSNLPQSVNLEFQSGVAEDTLVFGSIRWVDWTDFTINPEIFQQVSDNPLVAYQRDTFTFTLGVGRRFNENWSGSAFVQRDTGNGNPTGNLGPVGGRSAIGLGATYTMDNITVTAGASYFRLGSARTTLESNFTGNSALGASVRIGYRF